MVELILVPSDSFLNYQYNVQPPINLFKSHYFDNYFSLQLVMVKCLKILFKIETMTNFGSFVIMTSQSEARITHLLMTHLEVQIHHFPNTAERTEIFQIYKFRNK